MGRFDVPLLSRIALVVDVVLDAGQREEIGIGKLGVRHLDVVIGESDDRIAVALVDLLYLFGSCPAVRECSVTVKIGLVESAFFGDEELFHLMILL